MATPTPAQIDALQRLWKLANGHSGQCRYIARVLLGLYNGQRFPFDLTDFRCIDTDVFRDCLVVLVMDHAPRAEVHVLLGLPGEDFERLARDWGVNDHSRSAT